MNTPLPTPLHTRLASLVLAGMVTLALLMGVETLATPDETAPLLGQTGATKPA